jgi:predicted ATPase/GAF domain-containing protein
MRLLAKDPSRRPVNAAEFLSDCHLPAPENHRNGVPAASLQIPSGAPAFANAFCGRTSLLRDLRASLEEGAGRSLTLIEGEPGAGKTSLLRELQQGPAVYRSCWGKFSVSSDQTLSGWVSLARGLADEALTASHTEFQEIRERTERALGASAPVLAALVEEWGTVLQCEAAAVEDGEGGLNRTAVALHRLLTSYAEPTAPLWVFLDDLQWADASSLRILELVLTLPTSFSLRVVATVRSSEADHGREELRRLRADLEKGGVEVNAIPLAGLDADELGALVDRCLGFRVEGRDDLVRFLSDKTRGNPFFVRELLAALVRDGAVVRRDGHFLWKAPEAGFPLPESLQDLLAKRVHSFSPRAQHLLAVIACMGGSARRSDLCAAELLTPHEAATLLAEPLAAGILHEQTIGPDATDGMYQFGHDRLLEAARGLLSDPDRAALCLKLFRLLAGPSRYADGLSTFTAANLFNEGSAHLDSEDARLDGVKVNLEAGAAAKKKGAHAQTWHYLDQAVSLLRGLPAERRWHEHRLLARDVWEQAAEAALLSNHFEESVALANDLLSEIAAPLERVTAHQIIIRARSAQRRFAEALAAGERAQSELGIRFPRKPTMRHVILSYLGVLRRVKKVGATHIASLPLRKDEAKIQASRLMHPLFAVAHFHKPELFPLFVFREIRECLDHGLDANSPPVLGAFALILAGLGEVDFAYELANVLLGLPAPPVQEGLRCRATFPLYSFVTPWVDAARDSLVHLARVSESALEHGDFEFAGFAVTMRALGLLYLGTPLADLATEFDANLQQMAALGQERGVLIQSIMVEVVHELVNGIPAGPLSGPRYERQEGLARCQVPMDHTLVFHHHLARMCVAAHYGDVESARDAVEEGRSHLANGAFASYLLATYRFYETWTWAAAAEDAKVGRWAALRALRRCHRQLRSWSRRAPGNFASKAHFAAAERARLTGRLEKAGRSYDAAIEAARGQGNDLEAALIHQRAATLWLARGHARVADQYFHEAHRLYGEIGAFACAADLVKRFPRQLSLAPTGPTHGREEPGKGESLDYRTLIKASQAISGEMLQPRLLERLLQTLMQHTAAQRGLLILEQRGELSVVAESDVDEPHVHLMANETVETTARACRPIVRYVARVEKTLVLADATVDPMFSRDRYIQEKRPHSVLCTPILYQTKLLGLIYLENARMTNVFNRTRVEMVSLLASQAAISIANARFHSLQLEAQQAKISPHFLFNALSSIAELAVLDGQRAETAIVKLAHLYRYVLASSPTDLVPLDRELAIVKDYLSLEKLRFGGKLDFTVTHEGPLEKVRLPGLLIQPLVENSIRHAVAPKLGDGRVWVHATVQRGRCTVVVQDDGDGTKSTTAGTGFGLRSVQQRLELVYGADFSFAISQRNGYRVELEVPQDATRDLS